MYLKNARLVRNFLVILRDYINGMECVWIMSSDKLINIRYGIIINTGNYESERIDCTLTLPLEEEFEVQFDQMFRKVKMKVLDKGGKFGMNKEALEPDKEYVDDPRLKDTPKPEIVIKEEVIKKGKYTWYAVEGGGKVRKCNNEPCPYYLKWNDEAKTYEHGKYDANTKVWSYVNDRCEFYTQGG